MQGTLTITAKTYPKCDGYLRIRKADDEYKKIEDFIKLYPNIKEPEIYECMIKYRAVEKTYREFMNDYLSFADQLQFVEFNPCRIIIHQPVRVSKYFIEKAIDCLQTARFFAIKSHLILDRSSNFNWSQGYIPQYSFRCTYFGTAVTWYSNTFDQLLQAVFWAFELYTDAVDNKRNHYNDSWDAKKTLKFCNFDFVIRILKKRGNTDTRKLLISCFKIIEEVRSWANYIKHKGGIDYKDLQPKEPFRVYTAPPNSDITVAQLDERFAIENFKSPIEIDIDEKSNTLLQAHCALYECITQIIDVIDFKKYSL